MKALLRLIGILVALCAIFSPVALFAQEEETTPTYNVELWIAGHVEYQEVYLHGEVVEADADTGEYKTKEEAVEAFQTAFTSVYKACRAKKGAQGVDLWNQTEIGGFGIDGNISSSCLNTITELGGTVTNRGFSNDLITELKDFAIDPELYDLKPGYYNRVLIIDQITGPVGIITSADRLPDLESSCFQWSLSEIGWHGLPSDLFMINSIDSYGHDGEGFGYLLRQNAASNSFEVSAEIPDLCSPMIEVAKPSWLSIAWQNDALIMKVDELTITIHTSASDCTKYETLIFNGGDSIVESINDDVARPVATITHETLIGIQAATEKIYVKAEERRVVKFYTHEPSWSDWYEVAAIVYHAMCEGGGPCGIKGEAVPYITQNGLVFGQSISYIQQFGPPAKNNCLILYPNPFLLKFRNTFS